MRLGATVLATTALASGLAFATPAFADSTVAAVKPHDGGCSAYRTGDGFKISACITYQKKGKYKGKVLSYLDVRGVPSKKKKCQILGQTYKPGRPISKLKHFSCTKGNKIISATKPAKGLTLHNTGSGVNDNRLKAEATSPQIWFS